MSNEKGDKTKLDELRWVSNKKIKDKKSAKNHINHPIKMQLETTLL